jgi:hypothetical protein
MSKVFSLNEFARYISLSVEAIRRARQEVEEVQVGFNSAYVEWKAPHDATLESLVETIIPRLDELGPDLRARVEHRLTDERAIIAERRTELEKTLILERRVEADHMVYEGQQLTAHLRETNPRLDREEEEYKAQRVVLRTELGELNNEIRRRSGCFVVVINFFKLSKLDRQRQKVIGQLQVIENHLKRVREEWDAAQEGTRSQQESLQARWQQLTLELAQMQGERDYLAEEDNREALALRRAIRYVIDNLKDDLACPVGEVKRELDRMGELNIQTDEYQDGLASVVSLLAMMDGVAEGMERFGESVDGLREEQRMHGEHLPKLRISVPDESIAFHGLWIELAQKVRDDRHLAKNPSEFISAVQPVIEEDLSDARIEAMFTGMGEALERATSKWRG